MSRGLAAAVLLLASCTPGAVSAPAGSSTQATVIDVNLTLHAPVTTSAGTSGGYAPAVTNVSVGAYVRFVNSDSFAHTATLIPGAAIFPSASPFSAAALTQSGTVVSQPWSTGALQAGASSSAILIDRPGTFLYGCFYHYGAPMRGTIVAH